MKKNLRLAISINVFSDLPLIERYRKIASTGIRNVLLTMDKDMSVEEAESAYRDFVHLGLKCVQVKSLHMPKSYVSEDHFSQAMDEFNKLRDIAKIYGTRQIALTAGSFRGKKQEHLDAAVKFISEACDTASENGMYCALDFTPQKNQLIKKWDDMTGLFEKIGKENLLININTAYLHHFEVNDEEVGFIAEKSALMEIEDILGEGWHTDINIGEGMADIASWVHKTEPLILSSCARTGSCPAALIIFKNADSEEIKRTLKYLENILPGLKM